MPGNDKKEAAAVEDLQIVALYWARDQRAIGETESKYGRPLAGLAMNILGDEGEAEECVNDTYLAAWNSMPEHRPERLGAYLAKLTRRVSVSRLRARLAQKRGGGEAVAAIDELAERLPSGDDTARAVETAELARALDRFLDGLGEREKALFLRRYFCFEPAAAIAEAAGISPGAVKASLHRTRVKLWTFLEREDWI